MLFPAIRTGFCLLAAILLVAALPARHAAADSPIYTIKDVKVDVTAENAAKARENAFVESQQQAFQRLAEQLLTDSELANFTLPPSSVIAPMIKDFEITEEQLSTVRYIGTYTFRFKADKVRNYLDNLGVNYSDVGSKPILVLPFYHWNGNTVLWGQENPFLAAWARGNTASGLVPLIVPIGDLLDVSEISDSDMLSYNTEELDRMVARYDAGEAIILEATPFWRENISPAASMPSGLKIALYRTDLSQPELAGSTEVIAHEGDTPDMLFDRAVTEIVHKLQKRWKSRTAVSAGRVSTLEARVPYSNMREWIETQKALHRVQGINEIKILSLKPDQAHVRLVFQGDEQRLRLALSQADMTLSSPSLAFNPYMQNSTSPLVYELYLNKFAGQRGYP